jgi:hypothetical protein
MAWTIEPPLVRYLTQLLDLRLRTERVQLARKVRALEERVQAEGIDPSPLRDFRRALGTLPILEIDPLYLLEPQQKPKASDLIHHLKVRRHPASIF